MSSELEKLITRLSNMMEDHERGGLEFLYTIYGNSEIGFDVALTHITDRGEDDE